MYENAPSNEQDTQGITISELHEGVLVCLNCDEAFASADADPLCRRCREFQAVIELLAIDHPGTVDYHVHEGGVDLFDQNDKAITTITEEAFDAAWNLAG